MQSRNIQRKNTTKEMRRQKIAIAIQNVGASTYYSEEFLKRQNQLVGKRQNHEPSERTKRRWKQIEQEGVEKYYGRINARRARKRAASLLANKHQQHSAQKETSTTQVVMEALNSNDGRDFDLVVREIDSQRMQVGEFVVEELSLPTQPHKRAKPNPATLYGNRKKGSVDKQLIREAEAYLYKKC